ncbi:MAG: GNAT family N-acetyltransferase [Rhodobacteraceae bacterium]|nr:GNAT family N-acetyltransferase [Paracoccaceae bacterium]
MGKLVRPSTDGDMEEVRRIYAHEVFYGLSTFEEFAPDLPEMMKRRQGVLALGMPHLVAELDGKILGFAYASRHRPRPAYNQTIENSVYVAKDMRGTGIGKMLLTALIEECEHGPWRQVVAVIGDSGNAGSIGLHRSLGFRQVGILQSVGFKFGRWVDTVIMQRPLNDGDEALLGRE